jgi:hypothetical protein
LLWHTIPALDTACNPHGNKEKAAQARETVIPLHCCTSQGPMVFTDVTQALTKPGWFFTKLHLVNHQALRNLSYSN